MLVEPLSVARFQVVESGGKYSIIIPAARNWFVIAFLSCWLGGWTMGELTVGGMLLSGRANAFMIFWLGGWTVGGAFVLHTIARMLAGQQCLSISAGVIEVSDEILGLARSKRYSVSDICAFRAASGFPFHMYGPRMMQNPSIEFDYGSKTVGIARGATAPVPGGDRARARRRPRPCRAATAPVPGGDRARAVWRPRPCRVATVPGGDRTEQASAHD